MNCISCNHDKPAQEEECPGGTKTGRFHCANCGCYWPVKRTCSECAWFMPHTYPQAPHGSCRRVPWWESNSVKSRPGQVRKDMRACPAFEAMPENEV